MEDDIQYWPLAYTYIHINTHIHKQTHTHGHIHTYVWRPDAIVKNQLLSILVPETGTLTESGVH